MKVTNIGSDYIVVNEKNYKSELFKKIKRVHLIKLDFDNPTSDLLNETMYLFLKTNRYVIEKNIREYNNILRKTEKKYYVMNKKGVDIISFFRKNNKILFNFINLSKEEEKFFLTKYIFEDLLKNTEVIALNKRIYDDKIEILNKWKGNCIIVGDDDKI